MPQSTGDGITALEIPQKIPPSDQVRLPELEELVAQFRFDPF
jgi:hypothetical protein